MSTLTQSPEAVANAVETCCGCVRICRLSSLRRADGPLPECAPKEHYFYVVRDQYVKSADGGCEWDGDFLEGRHATFEAAMEVVRAGHELSRYVVEEVPRFGAFPKWTGHGGTSW